MTCEGWELSPPGQHGGEGVGVGLPGPALRHPAGPGLGGLQQEAGGPLLAEAAVPPPLADHPCHPGGEPEVNLGQKCRYCR